MAETDQPYSGGGGGGGGSEWRHDLFSCSESLSDCLFACMLPMCFNFVATKAAGESTGCAILTCLCPIGMCCVRGKVREQRGINGSAFGDFCTTHLCHCCSSIQIKREFED